MSNLVKSYIKYLLKFNIPIIVYSDKIVAISPCTKPSIINGPLTNHLVAPISCRDLINSLLDSTVSLTVFDMIKTAIISVIETIITITFKKVS